MIRRHTTLASPEVISARYTGFMELFSTTLPALKLDYYSKNAESVFSAMTKAASYSVVLNLKKSETYQSLFYMLQFGLNHFKLSSSLKERQIRIGESMMTVKGRETRNYIDFGTWMTVFYSAVILRDRKAIDFLTSLENNFMKQGVTSYDDVRIAEVDVYKVLFEDSKFLAKAIEIYDAKEMGFSKTDPSRDWIDYQGTPVITLCKAILLKNAHEFNAALINALEKHKEFFERKENAASPWGWISFPLLMICAYAFDKGMPITVESDYIPKWIVEGDFRDCEVFIK